MIRALAIKELRESLAVVALAAAALVFILGNTIGWRPLDWSGLGRDPASIPFLQGDFDIGLMIVLAAVAIALGLKQTVWEHFGNTYYFLLHRPIERKQLFVVKLCIGIGLVVGIGALAIVVYGAWAATPGTHASPFFWGMTAGCWQTCATMPTLYLGAALSGLRQARWFGTRILPLVGAGLATFLFTMIWIELSPVGGAALLAGLDAILVGLILRTAETEDF